MPNYSRRDLWQQLVQAHLHGAEDAFARLTDSFMGREVERVALLRVALRGRDRGTALLLLPHLAPTEVKELFEAIVWLASFAHGAIQHPRNAILSLPREWVLQNVERIAEPILYDGTYDEYRRLLELYALLDRDLALKLAHRAAVHADPDIQEAGQDFLLRLR